MSLTSALMIASQSLGTISNQINIVSKNISNAGTDGSSKKTAIVSTGPSGASELKGVGRATNLSVFRTLLAANSNLAKSSRVSNAMDQIDLSVNLSDPENSRAPAVLISKLADALVAFSANPDDRTRADSVIQFGRELITSLHDSAELISAMRREADDNIARGVESTNEILDRIYSINRDIITSSGKDDDTTDLMDQRDNLLKQLSGIIGIKTAIRPNNDVVIYADNGTTIFETSPRYVTFQKSLNLSAGGIGAAIYIDGVQATGAGSPAQLKSGSLAGDISVRDDITPFYQAQLDEIARTLITAFAEYDQSGTGHAALPGLFTIPNATTLPDGSYISGLAEQLSLNPLADPNQGGNATLLRDGGISGNNLYIYNTEGSAGYNERILELADSISISHTYSSEAGLISNGSLLDFSQASIGWVGAHKQQASGEMTYENAFVTRSTILLSSTTGVNIDEQMTQMLTLENAYQASAKVLQTINSIYDTLFSAINR